MLDLIVPMWAREWLGKQEAVTVLLFLILAMIPAGVVYIAKQADNNINKINASNEKRHSAQLEASRESLHLIIDTYEADQSRDEKRHERKDELIRDLLQRNGFAGELKPANDLP